MIDKKRLEKILVHVSKPARYIGEEINQTKKEWNETSFKMALSYPDLYDIGMSNLGIKILYEIINSQDNMLCERVFHPAMDMVEQLQKQDIELFSLESKTPLKKFDILGFSLQFEMTYTNVLSILDLAKIPLFTKDRRENDPIVIAGGPCVFNPEPLKDFIDVFVIGEGEKAIVQLSSKWIELKEQGLSRSEILEGLSQLPGLYIPTLYDADNKNAENKPDKIKRWAINNINEVPAPVNPPIPYVQVVQDIGAIEVSRGCTVGCRFCQAGMIYRPVRERTIESIVQIAEDLVRHTGYREISLLSLSIADYTKLPELVDTLNNRFSSRKISFAFPSLRIDGFSLDVAQKINKVRKSGLTFAVEAGSEYIRDVINKKVSENKLVEIVGKVTTLGWRKIKLYFMIGFPLDESYNRTEEEDIIELINKLLSVNKSLKINVTLGTFVPKSHTPFQWSKQLHVDEAQIKMRTIMKAIPNRRVSFKKQPVEMSFIEGLMARGDQNIGKLIYHVYNNGARFDSWDDHFNFGLWMKSIKELDIDIDRYLFHNRLKGEVLPWDHIDCTVTNRFLLKELDKSFLTEETPDCRDKCHDFCGVCDKDLKRFFEKQDKVIGDESFSGLMFQSEEYTIRLKFTKLGILKLLSHLEVVNLFQKAFMRMSLPIVFSQGFNPIPKMEFANPLTLGIRSDAEYLQFKVAGGYNLFALKDELNKELPKGIQVIDFVFSAEPLSKLQKDLDVLEYIIELDEKVDSNRVKEKIELLNQLEYIPPLKANKKGIRKDRRNTCLNVELNEEDDSLKIAFIVQDSNAHLMDYLHFLCGLNKQDLLELDILRTDQYTLSEKENEGIVRVDPLEIVKEKAHKEELKAI